MDSLSIAATVAGLIQSSAMTIATCKTILGKYKNAPRTLSVISTECSVVKASLSHICYLISDDANALAPRSFAQASMADTFDIALTSCAVTFRSLMWR